MPTEINAKVIADSISERGDRLTTMEVTYPRFVHAELMTHRVFSRNAASSRAIPLAKMMQRVEDDPAMPVVWPSEQRGMQGGDELERPHDAKQMWLEARDAALRYAGWLQGLGLHKSLVNRILEPWAWMTVIVTATEWEGFFHQRCHEAAMPELRVAAEAMRDAHEASKPGRIGPGEWHLPYIDASDVDAAASMVGIRGPLRNDDPRLLRVLKRVSTARCARVSYLTHDGQRDIEKDLMLFDRLTDRKVDEQGWPDSPVHWSPLEHVATPCTVGDHVRARQRHLGNFTGWDQFRHTYAQEKGVVTA